MRKVKQAFSVNGIIIASIIVLTIVSTLVLKSIIPGLYPTYFIYIILSIALFYLFSKIDFEIIETFSPHLYFLSVFSLLLLLIIGQVTRGAIRWIPVASITIQPSELVRPFLLLYLSRIVSAKEINIKRLSGIFATMFIPVFLILIQPSFGVAALTAIGFLGVLIGSGIEKKFFLKMAALFLLATPLIWFLLQPYQKERVTTFLNPSSDPTGRGYNSIQSMIAVGSGRFLGRGLGEGVQTQLKFLPEKHTDFIFAAVSEEMGLGGGVLVIICLFLIFYCLILRIEGEDGKVARGYTTGVLFLLLAESVIHVGMNMGLFPITGVPLPFVSAGGSSLVGTSLLIAISLSTKRRSLDL